MGWGAAIGAGLGLLGAGQASQGGQANARQLQQGVNYAQGMYRDAQGNLQPYMQFGQTGLNGLSALMGGDYSGFMNSPDFLASQKAGIYALDSGAAARGNLFSGGHQVDLANKMQDHASGYLNNYRNHLMGVAGMGQNAASTLGSLGQQSANTVMGGYAGIGQAQQDARGAVAGGLFGLGNMFGSHFGGAGGGGSVYGGGANAAQFGLPTPVTPYANTNWGSTTGGWDW